MQRLISIDSRNEAKAVADLVHKEFDAWLGATDLLSWVQQYIRVHAIRCRADADFLLEKCPNVKDVLNIGGAPYIFEYFFQQKWDGRISSVDLEPERLSALIGNLGIDVICVDIERPLPEHEIGQRKFDLICMCEIFEHLRIDILKTMQFVRSLLREDGMLYLTTPNGAGILKLIRNIIRHKTGPDIVEEWQKLATIGHMGHVREYSPSEVLNVLRYVGFDRIEVYYRNRYNENTIHPITKSIRTMVSRAMPSYGDEIIVLARNGQA